MTTGSHWTMATPTQKRTFDPRPSHCLTCVVKKLKCKGGGPGEGSCVACAQRELECVWRPMLNEKGEIEKVCRAPSSDEDCREQVFEKRLKKANGSLVTPKIPLPCPYFLRDPVRPRKNKVCFDRGWNFSRLKEHLHRVHKLPIQCIRCHASFDTQQALKYHLLNSSERMCEVIDEQPEGNEGFDVDQEKALKAKRLPGQTDLEGWNDMWLILFPADGQSDIPNPYDFSPLYHHAERLRKVVDSLTDLVSIPSDSISVEELQNGIKNLLKEIRPEPSSGMPIRQKHQADPPAPTRTSEAVDKNPFHRTRENCQTEQISHDVKHASAQLSGGNRTTHSRPAPGYLTMPLKDYVTSQPQERPSEKWYRAQQARLSATSPTAVYSRPVETASSVPIDPVQRFDEWSAYPLDPIATFAAEYNPQQHHVTSSSTNHFPVSHQPSLADHTQLDFARYGWQPTPNNPFGP